MSFSFKLKASSSGGNSSMSEAGRAAAAGIDDV